MSERCAGPPRASCCHAPHSFPIELAEKITVVNHAVKELVVTRFSPTLLKTPKPDPGTRPNLTLDACYDKCFMNDGPTPKLVGTYSFSFNNILSGVFLDHERDDRGEYLRYSLSHILVRLYLSIRRPIRRITQVIFLR